MILLETLLDDLEIAVQPFALCEVFTRWRARTDQAQMVSIHYVLEGSGMLTLPDNSNFAIRAGSMVIVPRGVRPWIEPHLEADSGRAVVTACRAPDKGWPRKRASPGQPPLILACGTVTATYQRSVGLFDYLAEPIVEDFSDSPHICRAFRLLLTEMARPQPGSRIVIESVLRQCLVMLLRRHCTSGRCQLPWLAALENPKLGVAVATMLKRPQDHHTLESLANAAGMSRSAFAVQFAAAFGRPAIAFLREIRLRAAARQLARTDHGIKAVAASVGIRSRSYFWRAFKALYGLDPAAYRAKHRYRLPSRETASPSTHP